MSGNEHQYLIPETANVDSIKAHLAERYRFREESGRTDKRIYYDSFDWRLYQAGALLEGGGVNGSARLRLRGLDSGNLEADQVLEARPRFAWDLPDGALRERLQPLLEMRALLPRLELESRIQALRLLDDQDKTVLRLQFEQHRFKDPDGSAEGAVGKRLRLLPVKGYDKALSRMHNTLSGELQLLRADTQPLEQALQALGRPPGSYSSKLRFRLDPKQRADAVAKQILLQLLDTLEANVEGAKAGLDSEFLHDLRVATRRTRSALSQIKGVFPEAVVEDFKARFGWIGQVTGPTRDMDVYLLGFGDYRDSLPATYRGHLEPLHRFLEAHRQAEQEALARELDSARFRNILHDWREFLEAPVPEQPEAPNAPRPIRELTSQRILKMYKRVLKEGRAIGPETPPEHLHELRKSCKKLRYLIEFFANLYPKKSAKAVIKNLKALLDNLGAFQDLEVQAGKLRGLARQMSEEGEVPVDTLLAIGMLVDGLLERQGHARAEFQERFAGFDSDGNRRNYQQLFASE